MSMIAKMKEKIAHRKKNQNKEIRSNFKDHCCMKKFVDRGICSMVCCNSRDVERQMQASCLILVALTISSFSLVIEAIEEHNLFKINILIYRKNNGFDSCYAGSFQESSILKGMDNRQHPTFFV